MREDFRPILGYEGHYEINSEGVVVSLKRSNRKVMKPKITACGYKQLNLYLNTRKSRLVHRLVWESFNGKIPKGKLVLHGQNVCRDNCSLENLSLGTVEDNLGRDRRRDGTTPKGERNSTAILNEAQVSYIKHRIRDGERNCVLRRLFGVSINVIADIKYGRTWLHVA